MPTETGLLYVFVWLEEEGIEPKVIVDRDRKRLERYLSQVAKLGEFYAEDVSRVDVTYKRYVARRAVIAHVEETVEAPRFDPDDAVLNALARAVDRQMSKFITSSETGKQ